MKTKQIKSAFSAAVIGLATPLAMVMPASAADSEWVGSVSSQYGAFVNWMPQSVPGLAGDNAVFSANATNQIVEATVGGPFTLDKIIFNGNNPGTSSKSYNITGDIPFTFQEGIDAVMTGSGGDHSVELDSINIGDNAIFRTTGSNSLSVGADGSTLDLGTNNLTLDASGGTISLLGEILGSGNVVISNGKVRNLTTPGSGYTGSTEISDGEYTVIGTAGNIVLSGGKLKGTGNVGTVTMSDGSIAPGASPGVINTGDLALTGGTYEVELGGTADGEYDQTNVTGTVDLGSGTTLNLTLFGGYEPEVNDVFTIVNNDGADAVQGTFNGLANGDKVTLGEYTYQINYDAGDGNDVLVLVTGTPSAPDTGIGSIMTSPLLALFAALAAVGVIGGLKYADNKRK